MSAETTQNQGYSLRLGWVPSDVVGGARIIDNTFVDGVRETQISLGLSGKQVDGVCGPGTYRLLLAKLQGALVASGTHTIQSAGLIAMYEAKREWLRNIIDPKRGAIDPMSERGRQAINVYARTADGSDWDWLPEYQGDGDVEWCGMFCAYAWRAAGMKLAIRRAFFPSTYRLDRYGAYLPLDNANPNPAPVGGPLRMMVKLDEKSTEKFGGLPDGTNPHPGDIVMVGGVGTGPGKHITLCESYDPKTGVFITLEGNGYGLGPDGTKRQGVVRASRRIGLPYGLPATYYFVRRIIRPSLLDLV